MTYPKTTATGEAFGVPASPHFPTIEKSILQYWQEDGTFRASVERRSAGESGNNEFVFYDGPPFANGLPHYGHLLTGYVKDVVPRYMTMRGRRVERRFGWDCHGLPAELEAMRQLGMSTTDDIYAAGLESFNDTCRTSVLAYTDQWEQYVGRQARWVDFENDYKTLDPAYMESVIWAFKQLHTKGLAYEGYKVLPYCWNDETPLSNHELRMDDDTYKNRQDPAVTFGVRLETGEYALVWTTTPWTLPSNLGLAVHPELEYVVVESSALGRPEKFVLAAGRLASYARELADGDVEALEASVVQRLLGQELLGRSYEPPFTYFQGRPNAHQVMAGAFVTADDGTGIVHMAPAFGEDDMALCTEHGIEPVQPLDTKAQFTSEVPDYAGLQVFDANPLITAHLKNRTKGGEDVGATSESVVLLRHETYDHSYPHCWRCRKPLIYKAVGSWFVATTQLKDRMLELNQNIWWEPEHIRDGIFHKWLENVRDWAISRNRFWGCPIPVWKSDNPEYPRLDVYGSFAELEADFGVAVTDLHRPGIDNLTRPNPDDPTGQSTMRRVPDVLDCWFESGSMSFAQVHYPFENREWFENHFPGDFIVEYIGQTRGWFYTMHVLATALFDCNAFRSVLCHGIVLGNDGQKMSKSLRNYPDVNEVFDRDGADAMRWFLMASPILRGGNLVVTEQGIRDALRASSLPLWNTWYFFSLYANALGEGGYSARWSTSSTDILDQYLLAKVRELVESAQVAYDAYDISGVCAQVESFLDVLTNWYVRRSRERFWSSGEGSDDAAKAAFDTLYTTLEVLCRVVAPLLPMTSEEIWRGLTGGRSVHLTDWPCADDLPVNRELVSHMDTVREVCSTISSVRKAEKLRVRQPLAGATVVVADAATYESYGALIADEMNLKTVRFVDLEASEADEFGVTQQLVVNARAAGPRLGKDVQKAIKASKSGDWSVDAAGQVTAGGLALQEGEYALETVAGGGASSGQVIRVLPGGGFVAVTTALTPELELEGVARDVIRAVQQGRKEADLDVSDRISVTIVGPEQVWQACMTHQRMIMSETLAKQFGATQDSSVEISGAVTEAEVGDGLSVRIGITALADDAR